MSCSYSLFQSVEITAVSPCSGHCTTVLGDDVCRSCLRTFEEITRWIEMSHAERCAVNQRIAISKTNGFPPERSQAYPERLEGRE